MAATTRPASRARPVRIDAQHRCRATQTALLVVDMQHGFLDAGASLEVPGGRAIVPRLQRLVACCRATGAPVVFTKFVYSPAVPCPRSPACGGSDGVATLDDAVQTACFDIWRRKFARLRTTRQLVAELKRR